MKNFSYLTLLMSVFSSFNFLASDSKKDLSDSIPVILSFIDLSQEESIFTTHTDQSSSKNSSTSQPVLSFTEFKKENVNNDNESSFISNESFVATLSEEDEKNYRK